MKNAPLPLAARREFLSSLVVGATALTFAPRCLRAAGSKLPSLSFIVVTDTHLGYRDKESAAQQWEKTAAYLQPLFTGE